ncbi:MAG: hypothetical protein AB7U23_13280 [Dehalococcoidia bacterium]
MSPYRQTIREHLAQAGRLGVDPRHVEAWMRIEHPTLDALTPAAFRAEALVAADCTTDAGPTPSEALAASLGL